LNQQVNSPYKGYIPLVIDQIREVSKNFKTFSFREGHGIRYASGQFITLSDQSGLREIRRSYSIISSPGLKEPLTIAVKRIDNGFFSRNLVDRSVQGDVLYTTGAAGFFRLPEEMNTITGIFFFAAGSGIAPVLSLMKTVLYFFPQVSVSLVYSNQSRAATAFYPELKGMEERFPERLHIDFLFSSAADLRRARLNRELLLEFLITNRCNRERTLFYICGPESYMRMISFLLLEEGFPGDNIKKEDFNPGNKKTVSRIPPDKNTHQVNLDVHGISYQFMVPYTETILKAAQKLKLNLPYSCETGKCGSCAALCLKGKVWLSNNEVLTEKDLAQGLTLTCTGHPQDGDVVLKIV
jgi:ferredoxin-NADP reductase